MHARPKMTGFRGDAIRKMQRCNASFLLVLRMLLLGTESTPSSLMHASYPTHAQFFSAYRACVLFILVSFLSSPTETGARMLNAVGVEQIPLLFSGNPPWIHPDHRNFSGPLGAYLDTLLRGCGFNDGFNITRWANTSRMAEFDVLTGVTDIAFPVYRLWASAPTTLSVEAGGGHFLPVLSSPGATERDEYVLIIDFKSS